MAQAPRPGSTVNSNEVKQREANLKLVYKIKVRDDEASLRYADLGPGDAALVRKETGVTLRTVIGALHDDTNDYDYISIAYWLAKWKAGESVTYNDVVNNFPSYAEIGQISIVVDLEPEAGDDQDPLPSEGPSTGPQ